MSLCNIRELKCQFVNCATILYHSITTTTTSDRQKLSHFLFSSFYLQASVICTLRRDDVMRVVYPASRLNGKRRFYINTVILICIFIVLANSLKTESYWMRCGTLRRESQYKHARQNKLFSADCVGSDLVFFSLLTTCVSFSTKVYKQKNLTA